MEITHLEIAYYGTPTKVIKSKYGDIGMFEAYVNHCTATDTIYKNERATQINNLALALKLNKKY
jgi:hypothetical protein